MKKKAYLGMVLCIMCLSIVGCGKKDEVSQIVTDDITSIGEVTIEDEELIGKVETTYATLTDKQKEQVNNYADLLKAKESLELLKNDEINKNNEILEKERKFYSDVDNAILELKADCKNPASVKIEEVIVENAPNSEDKSLSLIISIKYSAQNGFGNDVNGYYGYYANAKRGTESIDSLYTYAKDYATGNSKLYQTKISDNHYAKSDTENSDEAFILNLEDYEANN